MRKRQIVFVFFLVIVLASYGIYKLVTKPLPGQAVPSLSRDHVTDIAGVDYNSNPPTSGPHFAVWAKPGLYDRLISDGYFIHSMEHGYVVIWYDCSKLSSGYSPFAVGRAYAHDEPVTQSTDSGELLKHMKVQPVGDISWFTPANPPEKEVALPESFNTESCKVLVSRLSEFTKVAKLVIVTPRVGMDTALALTAWGRIDRLESVDEARIVAFIQAFHDHGPEKTME